MAVKVAREVSGTFTRFATISRVVFVGWELTVTATSFPSAEMVIFLSLKTLEATFTLWPATASF